MVLKENILKVIDTPKNRVAIAAAMGLGEQTIRQYIKRNDSKLTQYDSLQAIKKITGIKKDAELMDEEKAIAAV